MRQSESERSVHRPSSAGANRGRFWSLSAAGFAATAIGFGPGRMGFGLFVPELKSTFSMSTSAVGVVSSLGFFGFFIGLLVAEAQLIRRGPGSPVLCGLAAATIGMGTVALAPSVPILALGVFLAASSAGLSWTPFNDAIHRKVREDARPTALSLVSTGTGLGVASAGLVALLTMFWSLPWRVCWALFATAGAAAFVGNWFALRHVEKDHRGLESTWVTQLAQRPALPLSGVGFAYGTTSAIYISFGADHIVEAGGVPGVPAEAAPALVFICYGLFGLTGLLTRQVRDAVGLPMLLRLLMVAGALSTALVGLAPSTWWGLFISAGLQGVHVMMTSAVLAFWSERLFPSIPCLGFTAALVAAAIGSVIGPAAAGMASDAVGAEAMFLAAAALPMATAVLLREHHAQERPVGTEHPRTA